MKLNRKWVAGGLIAAVLVVPFLLKQGKGDAGIEVDIAPAAQQEIRPTILASGVLAYRNEVNLTAELVAKVEMIAVEEGDMVEAGQLLLTLDPETYRNAIEREEASRRQSLISIQRQQVAAAHHTLAAVTDGLIEHPLDKTHAHAGKLHSAAMKNIQHHFNSSTFWL